MNNRVVSGENREKTWERKGFFPPEGFYFSFRKGGAAFVAAGGVALPVRGFFISFAANFFQRKMNGNTALHVRQARPADVDDLMRVFAAAREFMARSGNPNQWTDGYPGRELVEADVAAGRQWVVADAAGHVAGTFCFLPGPEEAYAVIEQGQWPGDAPYWVIHRVASDGSRHGVFGCMMAWCAERATVLRADTHADNRIMQRLLERNGFVRCGIIYQRGHLPRWAYQRG